MHTCFGNLHFCFQFWRKSLIHIVSNWLLLTYRKNTDFYVFILSLATLQIFLTILNFKRLTDLIDRCHLQMMMTPSPFQNSVTFLFAPVSPPEYLTQVSLHILVPEFHGETHSPVLLCRMLTASGRTSPSCSQKDPPAPVHCKPKSNVIMDIEFYSAIYSLCCCCCCTGSLLLHESFL